MDIGVYGLGRFGQFWVKFLMDMGHDVAAYNRSPREVNPCICLASLEEICQKDVLFLCTAISSMPLVAAEICDMLADDTLVLDTCSVKLYPLEELEKGLSRGQPVLGTHPMFGPDSADKGVAGLPIVISSWSERAGQYAYWERQFSSAGLKTIRMSAEEHDREAARTQGVTHFIGRLLSRMGLGASEIATLGYTKILEIMQQTCHDPWQLFMDLQRFNPYTAEVRNQIGKSFEYITGLLDSEDGQ